MGVNMEDSKKDDFERFESIFDSDEYTMEQILHNELIKLSNKSMNLMKVADDLIKSDSKFSRSGMENQKLNKENQLLRERIQFLEKRGLYLQNQNEHLKSELDRAIQSDSKDSCLLDVFKKPQKYNKSD